MYNIYQLASRYYQFSDSLTLGLYLLRVRVREAPSLASEAGLAAEKGPEEAVIS